MATDHTELGKVWRGFLKSYCDGVAAGCAAIIGTTVGYPFDLLKTRMQVSEPPKSLNRCLQDVLRDGGYRGLWRGVGGPLCMTAVLRGGTFSAYDKSTYFLMSNYYGSQVVNTGTRRDFESIPILNRLPFMSIGGGMAGMVMCCINAPMELAKVQVQVQRAQHHLGARAPEGITRCLKRILATTGPLGLYRGFLSHILRDGIGLGMFFSTYEFTKHYLMTAHDMPLTLGSLFGGSIAGTVSWTLLFPLDAIKSRLQKEAFMPPQQQVYSKSIIKCAKLIYQSGGLIAPTLKSSSGQVGDVTNPTKGSWRAFFRGFPPTLLRTIPIQSLNFMVYEQVLGFINNL